MRRGPLARIGLMMVALGVLVGCRVDTEVSLTVNPDGSGEVVVTATADAEVLAEAPDLAQDLRTDDLVASGWTVESPTPNADGGLTVVARRPFSSIAEANAVLTQLSGSDGPLRDLVVGVDGTSGDVQWTFDGQLDASRGLDSFADADLVALVGATPWLDSVTARGLSAADVAGLTFRVSLPGSRVVDSDATVAPGAAEFRTAPGDAPVVMSSKTLASSIEVSDARQLERRMIRFLVIYGLIVLVGVVIWRAVSARRRTTRRPAR